MPVSDPRALEQGQELVAYAIHGDGMPMPLVPASRDRAWMQATDRHFASRCLPLLMANQAGWFLLSSHAIRATWSGGRGVAALKIEILSGAAPCPAISHFGYGILTWHVPYLFRTAPGYNLLVRGPANWPKDGISALEGIVESDWSDATFTMNWQMTRRRSPVAFDAGEPIAMILPQRRGELETFRPECVSIASDPTVRARYELWAEDREWFNDLLRRPGSAEQRRGWEKHYFQGVQASGDGAAAGHQTKLSLRPFARPAARDE
jgi:hypothetical protein